MADPNVKYLNLRELFNSKIFRIPDYQRGYAWEKKQFDALWNDLCNIQRGNLNYHYTGMITVERIRRPVYQHWRDHFYFRRYKGYFVVDGQQRLTTITILVFEMIQAYFQEDNPNNDRLLGVRKDRWVEDYLIRNEDEEYPLSFVFGYHTDNPSDRFFKAKILEQEQFATDEEPLEQTAYTNQLLAAKQFFREKIAQYIRIEADNSSKKEAYKKLENLCQLLVERMMFDFKILDDALDIFVVFETMNTRGKGLSDLEKLKNRLIYLATLLQSMYAEARKEEPNADLRNYIVKEWKEIYKELGRNRTLLNSDDTLLNYHWIMYHGYDRKRAKGYAEDLFDERFTVSNVVNGQETEGSIQHYVSSLVASARWWYVLSSPNDSTAKAYTDDEQMTHALIRLNRLSYRYFVPLLFAGLESAYDLETKQKFLAAIERYIFLIFAVSSRRSNTGSSRFFSMANNLYEERDNWNLDYVIEDLDEWVSGGEDFYGYFQWSHFKQYLEPAFEQEHLNGYKDWSGLKYFLAEYQSREAPLTEYSQYKVMPIFSRAGKVALDSSRVNNLSKDQCRHLEGSLGNYILVRKPPQHWNTLSFEQIKQYLKEHQPNSDLLQYDQWDAQTITTRGQQMLQFMQERWDIQSSQHLSEAEQLDLLYLNFMQVETEE